MNSAAPQPHANQGAPGARTDARLKVTGGMRTLPIRLEDLLAGAPVA